MPSVNEQFKEKIGVANNSNVSRAWATLRIGALDLDPDRVTQALGILPTHTHRRGHRAGKGGAKFRRGQWSLSSQTFLNTTNLEEHIAWLLEQSEPVTQQYMTLRQEGTTADLFCFVESIGHGGPEFSPDLLRRIAALALPLGLDIYCAG